MDCLRTQDDDESLKIVGTRLDRLLDAYEQTQTGAMVR